MRGSGLLVVFLVACSGSAAVQEPLQGETGGSAGAMASVGGSETGAGAAGTAGALETAGEAGAGGADSVGQAGAQALAGAPAGGKGGAAGHGGVSHAGGGAGGGGKAQGGTGGLAGMGGEASSAAGAAQGGSGPVGCSGFVEYVVPVNTCITVTGNYKHQADPSCGADGIVSRDHCVTCASWTAATKQLTVLLSLEEGATVKAENALTCSLGCKYICN